jgi:restriction system protein
MSLFFIIQRNYICNEYTYPLKKKQKQSEFIKWFGPVLGALRALNGSAKPREIAEWIGESLKLPDEVLNERYEKSCQLKFRNQIAWARQYLVWEGLLGSSKNGVWTLTTSNIEKS